MDNDLRNELYSYDIINGKNVYANEEDAKEKAIIDARSIYVLNDLIESTNTEFENGISDFISRARDNSDNPYISEFAQMLLDQQLVISEKISSEFNLDMEIPWYSIPYLIKKGHTILLRAAEGLFHGANVIKVAWHDDFWSGPHYRIFYQFISFTTKGFDMTQSVAKVSQFEGRVSMSHFGIFQFHEHESERYMSRGRQYVEINTKPTYLNYSGQCIRKSYWFSNSYKADGRMMVDAGSMKMLDPNYDQYYGSSQNNGLDNQANEQLDMSLEKNLVITSPFIYGFSFLAKVWGEFRIDQISPISFREDAFEKLVLDQELKNIITALVKSDQDSFGDLIDGKGAGCIFLLHGSPGVGKTLTAEAIAEKLHIPLYSASAGELGVTPTELEANLRRVLDMASAWNAILLIDEADIFLERRGEGDVLRNAMVSIFLRMLEYYQGILFLTTNRVKDIDEAFYSRVSLGLHYDKFDRETRQKVWTNLLSMVDSEELDLDNLAHYDLNGRQIKHCIKLAVVIAKDQERKVTQRDLTSMIQLSSNFITEMNKI